MPKPEQTTHSALLLFIPSPSDVYRESALWLCSREKSFTARPLLPIHTLFNPSPLAECSLSLTNDQLVLLGEVVFGDLEVERSRSFPDAARDVVVRTVAGAEPTTEVAGLADGYATQMVADACNAS